MGQRFSILLVATCLLSACEDRAPAEPGAAPQPLDKAPATAEPTTAPAPEPQAATGCTYAYDPEATKLSWTAFKLSDKVGVGGTFKDIQVDGTQPASSPARVFEKMSFRIATASVDTTNPERDKKLVDSFFGTLQGGDAIRGKVKSLGDDKGVLALSLGGVTRDVEMAYSLTPAGTLLVTGSIDLGKFEGSTAVAALNKVCEAKHTGEDKVSKLWPDVDLKVEANLKKTCAEGAVQAAPTP